MDLFKVRSIRTLNIVLLVMVLSLSACNSGRLILRSVDSTTVVNERTENDKRSVLQDDEISKQVHSSALDDPSALDQGENDKSNEQAIISEIDVKTIDHEEKRVSFAEISEKTETNYRVKEATNKQYTPSGLMMILVSVLFVFLGLVFLYYVPYVGPVLAVVFFIAALIYLIVGLYNILVF